MGPLLITLRICKNPQASQIDLFHINVGSRLGQIPEFNLIYKKGGDARGQFQKTILRFVIRQILRLP
jgi:hypothetical protein